VRPGLFAFDNARNGILLVGGDKSDDWKGWYKANNPIADDRFEEHQAKIEQRRITKRATAKKQTTAKKSSNPKGKERR